MGCEIRWSRGKSFSSQARSREIRRRVMVKYSLEMGDGTFRLLAPNAWKWIWKVWEIFGGDFQMHQGKLLLWKIVLKSWNLEVLKQKPFSLALAISLSLALFLQTGRKRSYPFRMFRAEDLEFASEQLTSTDSWIFWNTSTFYKWWWRSSEISTATVTDLTFQGKQVPQTNSTST